MATTLVTFGDRLESGEFWVSDDHAWAGWLDRIDNAIREHDPWALLVSRPDTDTVIVDVLDDWGARVRRFNGRYVELMRPGSP